MRALPAGPSPTANAKLYRARPHMRAHTHASLSHTHIRMDESRAPPTGESERLRCLMASVGGEYVRTSFASPRRHRSLPLAHESIRHGAVKQDMCVCVPGLRWRSSFRIHSRRQRCKWRGRRVRRRRAGVHGPARAQGGCPAQQLNLSLPLSMRRTPPVTMPLSSVRAACAPMQARSHGWRAPAHSA